MKKLILILLVIVQILQANPWELDSSDGMYLMETDLFYLSLIPENHEVVLGVSNH